MQNKRSKLEPISAPVRFGSAVRAGKSMRVLLALAEWLQQSMANGQPALAVVVSAQRRCRITFQGWSPTGETKRTLRDYQTQSSSGISNGSLITLKGNFTMSRKRRNQPPTPAQVEQAESERCRKNLRDLIYTRLGAIEDTFTTAYETVEADVGQWMKEQGFDKNSELEMLALMHTEISEATEAVRNPPKETDPHATAVNEDKVPTFLRGARSTPFDPVAEELADTVIRIMHYSSKFNHAVAGAIVQKMRKNLNRPYLHGKLA